MKRSQSAIILLCLLFIGGFAQQVAAQSSAKEAEKRFLDFTVGLGIDLHTASSIADYINSVAQPIPDQKVNQSVTAVEFYATPELQVSQEWSTGIEYSLLIKSYSIDARSGYSRSEMSYQVHMPTLLLHYLVFGEGYRIKLGGGLGYHFATFDQSFPTIGSGETFRTQGVSVKLDAAGNTKFDETFYGSIGVDLRWDFLGTLERSGQPAQIASSTATLPRMNFFNVGLKFGVTFQLY